MNSQFTYVYDGKGFNFTELFSALFSMISLLLGSDKKYSEAGWFAKISDFFAGN